MARLPVATINAGRLAVSAIAEWHCVGHLAFTFVRFHRLRARSRSFVSHHVHIAHGLVWRVQWLAASRLRERFRCGDGAHFVQCVCPEFLRRVFRGRRRLVFDWRLWGIDARFLRCTGCMALLVKEGSHCFKTFSVASRVMSWKAEHRKVYEGCVVTVSLARLAKRSDLKALPFSDDELQTLAKRARESFRAFGSQEKKERLARYQAHRSTLYGETRVAPV